MDMFMNLAFIDILLPISFCPFWKLPLVIDWLFVTHKIWASVVSFAYKNERKWMYSIAPLKHQLSPIKLQVVLELWQQLDPRLLLLSKLVIKHVLWLHHLLMAILKVLATFAIPGYTGRNAGRGRSPVYKIRRRNAFLLHGGMCVCHRWVLGNMGRLIGLC